MTSGDDGAKGGCDGDDVRRGARRAARPALLLALLALATLLAAATTAAIAPVSADAAAARRDRAALSKVSVRLGGATAPARLLFTAKRDAQLAIRLNGRRPTAPLVQEGGTRWSLPLTARDGLRPGRNTLRIRANRPGGRWDAVTRRFALHSSHPIADAGRDHAVVAGAAVTLGVAAPPAAGERPVRHRWEIVRKPRGASASLRGATSARPSLVARKPGTYVLRLTARGRGRRAVSLDTAAVDVRPDDPPIGVTIETFAADRSAGVWIDGKPQPATYDRNGIFVVVLNRRTRAVVESGTTPRHGGGVGQLREIAKHWDDDDRYLMIVAAPSGVDRGQAATDMRAMLRQIGVGDLRDTDAAALGDGKAFTAIGVAGAPGGTAWTNFGGSGALSGLLQVNRLTGTYDFIDPKRIVYDTNVGDAGAPQTSVVRFDGQRYTASLGAGVSGFHLLVFDGELRKSHEGAYATDTAAEQKTFADAIKGITAAGDPLLIVQSIGTPKGQSATWNQVVDALRPYGANPLVLNALDGRADSTYALVSRIGMSRAPAESSGKSSGAGQLAGVVARTHAWRWEPQFADELGEIDPQIVEVAYQAPRAFPPVNAAANKYVVQQLRFCPADDAGCDRRPADLRYYYWAGYSSDWTAKLTTLGTLRRPEGAAFSEQELTATVAQLQRGHRRQQRQELGRQPAEAVQPLRRRLPAGPGAQRQRSRQRPQPAAGQQRRQRHVQLHRRDRDQRRGQGREGGPERDLVLRRGRRRLLAGRVPDQTGRPVRPRRRGPHDRRPARRRADRAAGELRVGADRDRPAARQRLRQADDRRDEGRQRLESPGRLHRRGQAAEAGDAPLGDELARAGRLPLPRAGDAARPRRRRLRRARPPLQGEAGRLLDRHLDAVAGPVGAVAAARDRGASRATAWRSSRSSSSRAATSTPPASTTARSRRRPRGWRTSCSTRRRRERTRASGSTSSASTTRAASAAACTAPTTTPTSATSAT